MSELPLSLQLDIERLKRHLQEHPDQAAELAVSYFEDFSMLAIEYKKLEAAHQLLQSQSIAKPSLPHFLRTCKHLHLKARHLEVCFDHGGEWR